MGGVYLRLFVADPAVSEIDHPDRFARALLKSLNGLPVVVGQAGDETEDPETLAIGRRGDTSPAPSDGVPQEEDSDCSLACMSLKHLLLLDSGTKDVVADAGLMSLMPLVYSPIAGKPFDIGCQLLKELASYRPFAQKAAKDGPGLWKLLKRLAAERSSCAAAGLGGAAFVRRTKSWNRSLLRGSSCCSSPSLWAIPSVPARSKDGEAS